MFVLLGLACAAGPAGALAQPPASDDLIGALTIYITVGEDTLPDIAVAKDLGYTELVAANQGVDPWLPGTGTALVLPTQHILPDAPRQGIVINLADQRLYLFRDGKDPITFPIGIGTEGADVRKGKTRVIRKRKDPIWVPTANLLKEDPTLVTMQPGPDNPLGPLALDLEWTAIRIHGTNRVYGIGRRVSHGCFRMYNEDITKVFQLTPVGTPVTVVDQPVKMGWLNGQLYLEAHPSLAQAQEMEDNGRLTTEGEEAGPRDRILALPGITEDRVNWAMVSRVLRERSGVPRQITY